MWEGRKEVQEGREGQGVGRLRKRLRRNKGRHYMIRSGREGGEGVFIVALLLEYSVSCS